jgi:type I restriction enzyme S subunit
MSIALAPYPEYKDSGLPWLGKIPKHWVISPGFTVFRNKQQKNIGMIETTVLSLSYGKIIVKSPEKLHGLVPESFETYQIVDPGEIIIRPTDLQNDWTSLRVGISRNRGIITSAYLCLRTTDFIIPDYGYLLLHVYDLMKIFYGMGSGLRQNLDFTDIKRLPVVVLPKEEQAAIARFIEAFNRGVDSLIRYKRRLIELLNEQKQVIIHRAVTRGLDPNVHLKPSGIDWLGDVPEHWEVQKVKQCASRFYAGGTPDSDNSKYYCDSLDGIPWLLIADLTRQLRVFDSKNRITEQGRASKHLEILPIGTVVYSMYASLGTASILEIPACVNQAILGIMPDERVLNREYLLQVFIALKPHVVAESSASTQANLNAAKVRNLWLPLPPILEQVSIVRHIVDQSRGLDTDIIRLQREIELLREYRTRLVADVVTGKLDVRDMELPAMAEAGTLEDMDIVEDTETKVDEMIESEEVVDADE